MALLFVCLSRHVGTYFVWRDRWSCFPVAWAANATTLPVSDEPALLQQQLWRTTAKTTVPKTTVKSSSCFLPGRARIVEFSSVVWKSVPGLTCIRSPEVAFGVLAGFRCLKGKVVSLTSINLSRMSTWMFLPVWNPLSANRSFSLRPDLCPLLFEGDFGFRDTLWMQLQKPEEKNSRKKIFLFLKFLGSHPCQVSPAAHT